ncbi:fluoride ion exporter CrcB/FEX [Clostridium pascui]|uniref:CrcB family protein n=1 Tax=Clostridium pascui TaxID=46609 RepID=UPI00195AEA76|nr:fluoride ion exporter CrcB/FEX [Clostridium pascui]
MCKEIAKLINTAHLYLAVFYIILSMVEGNLYLLLADGFFGAYTTFSTFMYEGFTLIKDKQSLNALIYICGSLSLGICGFELGNLIEAIIR